MVILAAALDRTPTVPGTKRWRNLCICSEAAQPEADRSRIRAACADDDTTSAETCTLVVCAGHRAAGGGKEFLGAENSRSFVGSNSRVVLVMSATKTIISLFS